MASKETQELYKRALALSEQFDEHFLELASTLRQLRAADRQMFRHCIKNSGISQRKAYYLIKVDETFSQVQVPAKRLMAIGWTKLQLLAGHVTDKNLPLMLKLAETLTARDLKAVLKDGEVEASQHCVLMYFTDDQYANFADMVLTFGGATSGRGLVGKEQALMALIEECKRVLES